MVESRALQKLNLIYDSVRVLRYEKAVICKNIAGYIIMNERGEPLIERYYSRYFISERINTLSHYVIMESENQRESILIDLRTNDIIWVGVMGIQSGLFYDAIVTGVDKSGLIDTRDSRIKLDTFYSIHKTIRENFYVLHNIEEDNYKLLTYKLKPIIADVLQSVYNSTSGHSLDIVSILTMENKRILMRPKTGELIDIDKYMDAAMQQDSTGDRLYIKGNKVITFNSGAKYYVTPIDKLDELIKLGYTKQIYNRTNIDLHLLVYKIKG